MNKQETMNFVKQALLQGASQEDIISALEKSAQEGSLDSVVTSIVKQAGWEVNELNEGFIHGIMKEAKDSGYDIDTAVNIAKLSISKLASNKVVETPVYDEEKLAQYSGDFLKAAQEAGYSENQGLGLLRWSLSNKLANMDVDLFKASPAPQGPPQMGGLPQAGAPTPTDLGGGELQANPELIQQLMAMLGGNPEAVV